MGESVWTNKKLGVVGGGNMAEALVRGVISSGLIPPADISVYDPLPERVALFRELGCAGADSQKGIVHADVVLLATKPQTLDGALLELSAHHRQGALLISIAAGVSTQRIEDAFPASSVHVVRVMPNTPLLVGMGTSALCRGRSADDADMALGLALFRSCGTAVEVDESHMNSVTALSGSGPAYLFRFAEALMAGGTGLGMPPELAKSLTISMLRGSAEMLARYEDAALLRERVTSPGGTTAAALKVFDDDGLMAITAAALEAARARGEELGRGK